MWIGLHEPSAEEFEAVAKEFELHPLVVEDAINAHQRPKVEVYDHTVLVVLKTARYDADHRADRPRRAPADRGRGLRRDRPPRHAPARCPTCAATSRRDPERLRCGPAAVLHAVCDRVVDDYEPVADALDLAVQEVEADVFSDDRAQPGRAHLPAQAPGARPAAGTPRPWPRRSSRWCTGRLPHSHPELREYFRDVADHLARVIGRIDTTRELLTDVLDANLAQISVRQNEDMRTISAWAAVIAVPTMLAGIWGMNFEHMPELDWASATRWRWPRSSSPRFAVHRTLKRAGWL